MKLFTKTISLKEYFERKQNAEKQKAADIYRTEERYVKRLFDLEESFINELEELYNLLSEEDKQKLDANTT